MHIDRSGGQQGYGEVDLRLRSVAASEVPAGVPKPKASCQVFVIGAIDPTPHSSVETLHYRCQSPASKPGSVLQKRKYGEIARLDPSSRGQECRVGRENI